MLKCTNCGAGVGAVDLKCRYCGAQTPYGIQQERAAHEHVQWQQGMQAAHQRHMEFRGRIWNEATVRKSANTALTWSIVGAVLCCFPAGIVGFFMALKARNAAKEHNLVVPGSAVAAMVLGALSLLTFAGALTMGIISDREHEARLAEIRAELEGELEDDKLSADAACNLVTLELLENGDGKTSGQGIDDIRCPGALHHEGKFARLDKVKWRAATERHERSACFEKGRLWDFDAFYATSIEDCESAAAIPVAEPPAETKGDGGSAKDAEGGGGAAAEPDEADPRPPRPGRSGGRRRP